MIVISCFEKNVNENSNFVKDAKHLFSVNLHEAIYVVIVNVMVNGTMVVYWDVDIQVLGKEVTIMINLVVDELVLNVTCINCISSIVGLP